MSETKLTDFQWMLRFLNTQPVVSLSDAQEAGAPSSLSFGYADIYAALDSAIGSDAYSKNTVRNRMNHLRKAGYVARLFPDHSSHCLLKPIPEDLSPSALRACVYYGPGSPAAAKRKAERQTLSSVSLFDPLSDATARLLHAARHSRVIDKFYGFEDGDVVVRDGRFSLNTSYAPVLDDLGMSLLQVRILGSSLDGLFVPSVKKGSIIFLSLEGSCSPAQDRSISFNVKTGEVSVPVPLESATSIEGIAVSYVTHLPSFAKPPHQRPSGFPVVDPDTKDVVSSDTVRDCSCEKDPLSKVVHSIRAALGDSPERIRVRVKVWPAKGRAKRRTLRWRKSEI